MLSPTQTFRMPAKNFGFTLFYPNAWRRFSPLCDLSEAQRLRLSARCVRAMSMLDHGDGKSDGLDRLLSYALKKAQPVTAPSDLPHVKEKFPRNALFAHILRDWIRTQGYYAEATVWTLQMPDTPCTFDEWDFYQRIFQNRANLKAAHTLGAWAAFLETKITDAKDDHEAEVLRRQAVVFKLERELSLAAQRQDWSYAEFLEHEILLSQFRDSRYLIRHDESLGRLDAVDGENANLEIAEALYHQGEWVWYQRKYGNYGSLGETDIATDRAIIECSSRWNARKSTQVANLLVNPVLNAGERPVILYAGLQGEETFGKGSGDREHRFRDQVHKKLRDVHHLSERGADLNCLRLFIARTPEQVFKTYSNLIRNR